MRTEICKRLGLEIPNFAFSQLAEFASCAETLAWLISLAGEVDTDAAIVAASGRAR